MLDARLRQMVGGRRCGAFGGCRRTTRTHSLLRWVVVEDEGLMMTFGGEVRRWGEVAAIVAATTTTIVPRAQPVPATTVVTPPFLQTLLCLPPPSGVFLFNHVHVQPSPPPSHVCVYLTSSDLVGLWPDLLQKRQLAVVRLCWKKFGWENSKADELLLPVLKEYNKHERFEKEEEIREEARFQWIASDSSEKDDAIDWWDNFSKRTNELDRGSHFGFDALVFNL
ncbi:DNA repair protein UVH3 isoform X2 [Cucumis melo var. makuwa]|uniref:DNA repair protein UVH3 isoform X2 n=1 Tax=Cucumis melo var. makuwa TaxID=1194695 RepID=A0A5A7TXE5_CUCMM|nr:DNA repair protein UVH3 isoform X2 [Cucumis melo var. makuwa]TYK14175.1 DNA repair protein UVH3 isoform X2 [Cucumis melo var. makuwa]